MASKPSPRRAGIDRITAARKFNRVMREKRCDTTAHHGPEQRLRDWLGYEFDYSGRINTSVILTSFDIRAGCVKFGTRAGQSLIITLDDFWNYIRDGQLVPK